MSDRKSLPFDQFPYKFQRAVKRLKTPKRGRRSYSESTIAGTAHSLGQYFATVQRKGLPMEISHAGLEVFIEDLDARALRNSTRLKYLAGIQAIAKETNYPVEKRRLILEDCECYRNAMKADVPMKVRKLAALPITLRDIAKAAIKWRLKAQQEKQANKRLTYFRQSAYLALICFVPLRVKDMHQLEVGTNIFRQEDGWFLRIYSSKTDFSHNTHLDKSLTPYLDDLLLYGERGPYNARYAERIGTPLFANELHEALSARTMAISFKVATGHSPHIVRTLVYDALAEYGSDGAEIARVLCGHKSIQIAKFYEVHANKFRAQKAQESLVALNLKIIGGKRSNKNHTNSVHM